MGMVGPRNSVDFMRVLIAFHTIFGVFYARNIVMRPDHIL
jgi:hypothetical protein